MSPVRETLLCRYHYDPLDRLADCTNSAQANTQRFYLKDRLTTEIQGAMQRSIMQHEDQLLAQHQTDSGAIHLLATDQQGSVLNVPDASQQHPIAYSPYGHRPAESGLLNLLGFNGEPPDPVTGHYLLGNGYRAFNPVLMRFNSPDSWSPFGEGGLNSYTYCLGDPINLKDPTGHIPLIKLTPLAKANFWKTNSSTKKTVNYVARGGSLKNIKKMSDTIKVYDDTYKNQRRLNIDAHGIDTPNFKSTRVYSEGQLLDAHGLYSTLTNSNIDFSKYSNIRLLICHSANGGTSSLAAILAKKINKPVKGFLGEVIVEEKLELLTKKGLAEQRRIRMQPSDKLPPIVDTLIDKSRSYNPRKFHP